MFTGIATKFATKTVMPPFVKPQIYKYKQAKQAASRGLFCLLTIYITYERDISNYQ